MNSITKSIVLLLCTAWISLSLTPVAIATDVEARKGEVIPAPPTPPSPPVLPVDGEMMILGSIQMPAEVLKKLDSDQLADILKRQVSVPPSTAAQIFSEDIIVPGIVFLSITVISFLIIYFSFRKRREMLDTVRTAIQSGQTLPASFLEALESKSKPTPDGDLRKAVLLIALGLSAIVVLASLASEAGRAWSIGLVPTLLGIGYLFLWRQSQKRMKAGSSDDQR